MITTGRTSVALNDPNTYIYVEEARGFKFKTSNWVKRAIIFLSLNRYSTVYMADELRPMGRVFCADFGKEIPAVQH